MIDLHCHILPGIDDGPQKVDGSIALAKVAQGASIDTIVATPHVSWRYSNDSTVIAQGIKQVRERLAADGVAVEVLPGAEVAATSVPEIDAQELAKVTLGGGNWLLLEPPFTPVATGFDQIAYSLMRAGLRIVLAHPERCAGFHRDPAMLADLVRAGALTSITAGSLVGRFGKQPRRFATRMFEEGIAHNVASDAHDERQRPPGLAAELEWAGLGELRQWLTELVPSAILAGGPIPPQPPFRTPRRRGLLARLRGA